MSGPSDAEEGGIVVSLRQTELLGAVYDAPERAAGALSSEAPLEVALVDLRWIFPNLCLGK